MKSRERPKNMIDSGNFAGANSGSGHGGGNDSDMIARAKEQAQNNESSGDNGRPPSNGGKSMSRRIFVIGAGVVGVGLLGFGALQLFGKKEEPKPEEAASQQPETKALPKKMLLENKPITVGKDIDPGAWFIEAFDIKAKTWLIIERDNDTYELAKPKLEDNLNYWANQTFVMSLQNGDVVTANATIEKAGDNELPKSDTSKVGNIRSGMLIGGVDIIDGTWEVTPKNVLDEIDPKTGLSVEGDLTWQGRMTGLCAAWAKENKKTMEELQAACQGVITLDHEKAVELFGPMLAASIPFSAEEALIASGAELPQQKKTTEENKTNTEAGNTSNTTNQNTNATTTAAAPTATVAIDAWMDEGQQPTNTTTETKTDPSAGNAIPVTTDSQKTTEETKKEEAPKTMEEQKEGSHKTTTAVLASYFNGKEKEGFEHISKSSTTIEIKKGQCVLPILTDMILVKTADGKAAQNTSNSQTSSTTASNDTSKESTKEDTNSTSASNTSDSKSDNNQNNAMTESAVPLDESKSNK